MTKKEYKSWAKKFKKKVKKECRSCKKAHNGAYKVLCEHCINDWQLEINRIKRELELL